MKLILWALNFTNPVTGIVMTAVQWLWKAISYFFRGVFSFMQNPLEVFAVACIALVVFCFGVVLGIRYDAYKVKQAQQELATVYQNMSKKDHADAQKAAEAVMARRAAEAAERERLAASPVPVAAPDSTAAAAIAPAPAGVRKPANKVRRSKPEPSLLDSLQAAFE
jgi:signal transduction histidine kinase